MGGNAALSTAASGGRAAWVVPYYSNGRPLWRWAEKTVAPLRKHGFVSTNRSERLITFKNGGFLGVYSADNPDSILGEWFNLLVFDEAARGKSEVWMESLLPTLADYNGHSLIISTPKGRNWFWEWYQMGVAGRNNVASFHAPSSANPMPSIQKASILAKERVPERTYRQEWLAEFLEDEGTVFRNIGACLNAPPTTPLEHVRHKIIFGVDWGKLDDYTVISAVCVDCQREVELQRFNQIGYNYQSERLMQMYCKWQPEVVLVEVNAMGEAIADYLAPQLGRRLHRFKTTAASKPRLVESMQLALERAEFQWLPDEKAKIELEAYEMTPNSRTGRPIYSAPSGMHDDTVDARMLALRASTQSKNINTGHRG